MLSVTCLEVPSESHRLHSRWGRWWRLFSCGVAYHLDSKEIKRDWAFDPKDDIVGTGDDDLWMKRKSKFDLVELRSGHVKRTISASLGKNEGYHFEGEWIVRDFDADTEDDILRLTKAGAQRTAKAEGRFLSSYGFVHGSTVVAVKSGEPFRLVAMTTALKERWSVPLPSPSLNAGPWVVDGVVVSVSGVGAATRVDGIDLESGALLWSHGDANIQHAYASPDGLCLLAGVNRTLVRRAKDGVLIGQIAHGMKNEVVLAAGDGRRIALFSESGKVRLFDVPTLKEIGRAELPKHLMPRLDRPHSSFALSKDSWAVELDSRDSGASTHVLAIMQFGARSNAVDILPRARCLVSRLEVKKQVVYQIDMGSASIDEIMRCAPTEFSELAVRIGIEPGSKNRNVDRAHDGTVEVTSSSKIAEKERARIQLCLSLAERRLKEIAVRPGAEGSKCFSAKFKLSK